jgi:hypothetical protein
MAHDPEGEKGHTGGSTMSHASSTTAEAKDVERGKSGEAFSLWQYLQADVDPKETIAPLAAFSFMTGYM